MTTNSLSELKEHFKKWLENWDATIATHDDKETQQILLEKLFNGFGVIEQILARSDEKAMIKGRGTLEPGTDEAIKKEVEALMENQKKTWYKQLKNVSLDITYARSVMFQVYELKNRKTDEIFRLRSENAKLRAEIANLKK